MKALLSEIHYRNGDLLARIEATLSEVASITTRTQRYRNC